MDTLKEAKALWKCGLAVLWLHPKSKRPIGLNWTTGKRKTWEELESQYKPGMNVGVRLGEPSRLTKGYLFCVDIDVKKPSKEVLKTVLAVARGFLGPDYEKCSRVISGGGNGSRHLYAVSNAPFDQITLGKVKNEWEVIAYSTGRQMVLPPSVHPDTGKAYEWLFPFTGELPLISNTSFSGKVSELKSKQLFQEMPLLLSAGGEVVEDFKVEKVDVSWLPISDRMRDIIIKGTGVVDRSAQLLPASAALYSAELTRNEVLSVLTDTRYFLGRAAYDHAKTHSRKRAAEWVWRFTTKRIEKEKTPDFTETPDAVPLSEEDIKKQNIEFIEESWRNKLSKTVKGAIKPCFLNALLILENEFGIELFHKDDFSLRRTYGMDTIWGGKKGIEISDEDVTAIRRYIGEQYHFELEDKHVVSAITSISSRNHHHPVREYLDKLKWDGKPRIETWLKIYAKVEAQKEYLETISRKVLCAMVTRAYRPGAKFDYVLILEGPNQGEGKSRSIRALASPDWAGTVRFDMDHKDFVLALQGRWVTEISELSGLGKKNTAFVKAIVSEESDRIRHPYGRFTETLPRQGIFIGTTNHFQYLEDETGNRRFWPVRVGVKIDVEGLEKVRDQLFAEAKFAVNLGEPLYIEDPKVELMARSAQASRMSEDSWEETIRQYFKKEENIGKAKDGFKILDLFSINGPLGGKFDSEANLRRGCRALRRLGFHPRDIRGIRGHGKYWIKE